MFSISNSNILLFDYFLGNYHLIVTHHSNKINAGWCLYFHWN